MYIYVASSWSNPHQPAVVHALKGVWYEVYDFRNTKPGGGAFNWDQIDSAWDTWTFTEFKQALSHPLAIDAFRSDHRHLYQADVCIMVMPCGASSHLELGYAVGAGKHTAIYMPDGGRPELMYKEVDLLTDNFEEILSWLNTLLY